MADYAANFSIDDAMLKRGLDRATRDSERAAERMSRGWGVATRATNRLIGGLAGFASAGRAISFASRAMELYAERNDVAARTLQRAREANDGFVAGMGRDLIHLLDTGGVPDWVIELEQRFGRLHERVVNFWSDVVRINIGALMGRDDTAEFGNAAGVTEADKIAEEQTRRARAIGFLDTAKNRAAGAIAEAEGRSGDAARAAERERHQDRLKEISAAGLQAHEARELIDLENERHAAEEARIGRSERDRRREYEDELRMGGIRLLQAQGKEREAEAARIQAEYEDKIRKAQEDRSLSDADRNTIVRDLERQRDELVAEAGRGIATRNFSQLSGGFAGDASLSSAVMGTGRPDTARAIVQEQKKANANGGRQITLLREMRDALRRGVVGHYA